MSAAPETSGARPHGSGEGVAAAPGAGVATPRRTRLDARRAAATALAGVFLMLAAFAFAVPTLLIPGIAFTALGVAVPALVLLLAAGVELRQEAAAGEVVEGQRFTGAVLVGAGPLGLQGAALEDPLSGESVAVALAPALGRRRTLRVTVSASFARRGRKRLAPPTLRVCDPLGLVSLARRGEDTLELLVLPRTEPIAWRGWYAAGRHAFEHGTRADAFAASEVDGLRPYRAGTPASRIHWPAFARGAGLLERRMRSEHDSRPLVVLDSRCDPDDYESLDSAVRAAASLTLALARKGSCGLITAQAVRPLEVDSRLVGWHAARRRLALVEAAQRPPALSWGRLSSALFYVAAEPPGRLPDALMQPGAVLVLPAGVTPGGRWPVAFGVAGCVGYAVAARPARAPMDVPEARA